MSAEYDALFSEGQAEAQPYAMVIVPEPTDTVEVEFTPLSQVVFAHGTPLTDEDPAFAAMALEQDLADLAVELGIDPPRPSVLDLIEEAGIEVVTERLTPEEEEALWQKAHDTTGGALATTVPVAKRGLQSHAARVTASSNKMDWGTPRAFYEKLNDEFQFQVDGCAHARNKKHTLYFDEFQDLLKQDLAGLTVFLNPPYGADTPRFLEFAFEQSLRGATFVCVIAARVGTGWWKKWVIGKADEVRLVQGRLAFEDGEGNTDSATFDSAVVIYRPPADRKHTYMTYMER